MTTTNRDMPKPTAIATTTPRSPVSSSLRRKVFQILETAPTSNKASRFVDFALIALIAASVVAVILESMTSIEQKFAEQLYWFEILTISVFTVEYFLRVWSSVERETAGASNAFTSRLRFMLSTHAVIDLLAIAPFYLATFGLLGNADMRFLRSIRLLRVLKLTRYSSSLNMLFVTMTENGRALLASFLILLTVMLLAASGMYHFERESQPVAFGSIPAAMWWAFSTLTTVGYGDVTPISTGGKIFGAMITVVGIGMVALPTSILASGYSQQLRQNRKRYKERADQALDDGILSDDEIEDLESLRVDLGLGRNTASQILDEGLVAAALDGREREIICPHCGKSTADA